jgi:apolipoprotein N-acyltransferase
VGWGAVALGLVAVVAMAADGAAWSTRRSNGARSLPHAVVVAGLVVLGVLAILMILAALATSRARETPEQRRRRWTGAIAFILAIIVISIARLSFTALHPGGASHTGTASGRASTPPSTPSVHASPDTWWPVILVALIAAALFASANLRRHHRPVDEVEPEDETIALLDASLDDLRREPDPRRAVVAAYARMERRLAARGFARRPSETPTEYLQRALAGTRAVGVEPLGELTALAELARFSTAPVDESMRARAIGALEHLRAELRTADAPEPATT